MRISTIENRMVVRELLKKERRISFEFPFNLSQILWLGIKKDSQALDQLFTDFYDVILIGRI